MVTEGRGGDLGRQVFCFKALYSKDTLLTEGTGRRQYGGLNPRRYHSNSGKRLELGDCGFSLSRHILTAHKGCLVSRAGRRDAVTVILSRTPPNKGCRCCSLPIGELQPRLHNTEPSPLSLPNALILPWLYPSGLCEAI